MYIKCVSVAVAVCYVINDLILSFYRLRELKQLGKFMPFLTLYPISMYCEQGFSYFFFKLGYDLLYLYYYQKQSVGFVV